MTKYCEMDIVGIQVQVLNAPTKCRQASSKIYYYNPTLNIWKVVSIANPSVNYTDLRVESFQAGFLLNWKIRDFHGFLGFQSFSNIFFQFFFHFHRFLKQSVKKIDFGNCKKLFWEKWEKGVPNFQSDLNETEPAYLLVFCLNTYPYNVTFLVWWNIHPVRRS